jgi:CRP-like cAMP-binding protein
MKASVQLTGRSIPCERCPLRAKPIFREFTPEELKCVSFIKAGELRASAGATVLVHGTKSRHLYTVLSGWAFRYKTLPDGRRQILNLALPGDFLGLQGSLFDEMQHSVEALTDLVLCVFPREKLWTLFTEQPSLAFDVTWLGAREELMLDDHLLSVGRRTSLERTGYFLLTVFERAENLGLTRGNTVRVPFTQQFVADALGMSLVHTNKTLRRLSLANTLRWKDGTLELLDRDRLISLVSYDRMVHRRRPFI